jgi:hypothetical protein
VACAVLKTRLAEQFGDAHRGEPDPPADPGAHRHDVPTCAELVSRIVREAEALIDTRLGGRVVRG